MNATQQTQVLKQLDTIKPGENYPAYVIINEKYDGERMVIRTELNSFYVGMYAAVNINGKLASQFGDHDNKRFVTIFKKDLKKAIERGAQVIVGPLRAVTKEMPQ